MNLIWDLKTARFVCKLNTRNNLYLVYIYLGTSKRGRRGLIPLGGIPKLGSLLAH